MTINFAQFLLVHSRCDQDGKDRPSQETIEAALVQAFTETLTGDPAVDTSKLKGLDAADQKYLTNPFN